MAALTLRRGGVVHAGSAGPVNCKVCVLQSQTPPRAGQEYAMREIERSCRVPAAKVQLCGSERPPVPGVRSQALDPGHRARGQSAPALSC
jgi:CxxC motif-containing protein